MNIFSKFYHLFDQERVEYQYVSGTRNTVLNTREDDIKPGGKEYYRWDIHNKIKGGLKKGETIFYEIVGYDHLGNPIMSGHDIQSQKKKKELPNHYPSFMVYSYGCNPGEYKVYVYRITMQNDSGEVTELSWLQIKARCKELGLDIVPELEINWFEINPKNYIIGITEHILQNRSSTLDTQHLMEGICVRVESENGLKVYKEKNFIFKVLEGIIKEKDSYVDTEEIS